MIPARPLVVLRPHGRASSMIAVVGSLGSLFATMGPAGRRRIGR
jgi:hypothetical protein